MDYKRNSSIDIFRLAASIMVVAIHTQLMTDVNALTGFIMTKAVPNIAVPFFFCTSGYFYIKNLLCKRKVFINTMKKLLLVYFIWSIVYFTYDFLNILKNDLTFYSWLKNCITNFFINGSSYQLWFFPALFFCIIVVTIFDKLNLIKLLGYISILLYIVGCLGCSYYNVGNNIPVMSALINSNHFTIIRRVVLMGLPFYVLGYWLNIFEDRFISYKKNNIYLIVCIFLYLFEILFVNKFNLQISIVITIFLYFLVAITMIALLKCPLSQKSDLSHILRGVGNFIFYTHPLYIIFITKIWSIVISDNIPTLFLFIFTTSSSGVCGYILIRINNKFLNKLVY